MTELIIIKTNNSKELREFLQQKHINYEAYNEAEQEEKIRKKKWLADYEEQANDPKENKELKDWEAIETENWDD